MDAPLLALCGLLALHKPGARGAGGPVLPSGEASSIALSAPFWEGLVRGIGTSQNRTASRIKMYILCVGGRKLGMLENQYL